MKFFADQDVYGATIRVLQGWGHDVLSAAQLGFSTAEDAELLRVAHEQGRILITRDRDYGVLVFVEGNGSGVIYLHILPTTQNAVHIELQRALTLYSEEDLLVAFLVVEPGRHRIRRFPPGGGQQVP